MSDLPAKIANIVSPRLQAEEKVVFFTTKGLFSKTYLILTNQRLLIVKKGALIHEEAYLRDSEENICIPSSYVILTTQRLLGLDKETYRITTERAYVEPGETYVTHKTNVALFSELADFLILTDRALQTCEGRKKNFPQTALLPLTELVAVDLAKLKYMNSPKCCIVLRLRDEEAQQPWIIVHYLSNKREEGERFPRMISATAHVPFAPPMVNSQKDANPYIEFYVKTDLQWPQKCANCLSESQPLIEESLKIDKTALFESPAHAVGVESVRYTVPYCERCRGEKAIKNRGFDGVRAILEFTNATYADEFLQQNRMSAA